MDLFNGYKDPQYKIVEDYKVLSEVVQGLRAIKSKIVMTIGSWDLLHIGHVRYLRRAKEEGDILIVGVDTDKVVRLSKGKLRPVVPYRERCEMLTYQSFVDFVTKIDDVGRKNGWSYNLLKLIKPDVFVVEETSYSTKQLKDIKKFTNQLVILPRQAKTTSTTRFIQLTVKRHLDMMYELVDKR